MRDPWVARALLWRASCRRLLVPVMAGGGSRVYSCGPSCHWDVPAVPVEQDLLLKALVRAAFAAKRPGLVSINESRRWRAVDPLDSHAVLAAAFVGVEIDDDGGWQPAWRHETIEG